MLPQQPVIRLLPCQTRAVNAALLTRADANRLTVLGVADGVGLRVLEHNQRHNQVALGVLRQVVIRGHDVVQQIFINHKFIAPLLERDAKHLLVLNGRGAVGRVNRNDIVIALLLHFQQRQRLVGVAGSDDAVGHFGLNQPRGAFVAHVAQGNPVAEGGHAVCAARAGIGARQGGQFLFPHEVNLAQGIIQRQTHRRARRADMLERRRRGQTRRALEFADQLPAVERVKEVDVAGFAVQHGQGQFALFHINPRRLLIRVAAVLQFQLFHASSS